MLVPRRDAPSPKQLNNELTLKIYAGILCAMIVVFAIGDLAYHSTTNKPSSRQSFLLAIKRYSTRGNGWLYSPGNMVLLTGFLVTNAILCFVLTQPAEMNYLASRFGWMAAANTVLLALLGLKNTPLSLLTSLSSSYSYDRINFLHRAVGYATILLVILHSVLYSTYFALDDRPYEIIANGHWWLIPAGLAMLVLGIGGYLRNYSHYEFFYSTHVLGFVVVIITTALHRPNWGKRLPIVMILAGFIWSCDRVLRFGRMAVHFLNNSVELKPMANGGLKLKFRKPLLTTEGEAKPGQHCFVWLPGIRWLQTHPFTIVHNSPKEGLVVFMKAQEGFTRAARDYCCSSSPSSVKPGEEESTNTITTTTISLAGAAEGPYGAVPNLAGYDRVILVAGGSGATYTIGLLSCFLSEQQHREAGDVGQATAKAPTVSFLWAVKNENDLSWFSDELETFRKERSNISLVLRVTGSSTEKRKKNSEQEEEGNSTQVLSSKAAGISSSSSTYRLATSPAEEEEEEVVFYGKMNVKVEVDKAMRGVEAHERVLVAVCGPEGMVGAVNQAMSSYIGVSSDGGGGGDAGGQGTCCVDIHGESFGW